MTERSTFGGEGLLTGLLAASALLALGVLVQAWLGTSGFFQGEPGRVTFHGVLGNFLFMVAVIQAALALFAMQRGVLSRTFLLLSAVIVVALIGQIGLGYSTRNSENFSTAVSMHIPLGVVLMALTTVTTVLAYQASRHRPG